MVLDAAAECGVIERSEADRQIEMLEKATEIEKPVEWLKANTLNLTSRFKRRGCKNTCECLKR